MIFHLQYYFFEASKERSSKKKSDCSLVKPSGPNKIRNTFRKLMWYHIREYFRRWCRYTKGWLSTHIASHSLHYCILKYNFNIIQHCEAVGINTLKPRQNGNHFPDIFKCIFLKENIYIMIKISLKFVPMGPINNIPALVQIMAGCRPGDQP